MSHPTAEPQGLCGREACQIVFHTNNEISCQKCSREPGEGSCPAVSRCLVCRSSPQHHPGAAAGLPSWLGNGGASPPLDCMSFPSPCPHPGHPISTQITLDDTVPLSVLCALASPTLRCGPLWVGKRQLLNSCIEQLGGESRGIKGKEMANVLCNASNKTRVFLSGLLGGGEKGGEQCLEGFSPFVSALLLVQCLQNTAPI